MAFWNPLPAVKPEVPTRRGSYIDIEVSGGISIGGDIIAANWDGARPVNLSSAADSTATMGYAFDASAGAIQAMNIFAEGGKLSDLDISGNLTMATGGVVRTAASGQRLEFTNTDANRISFYSGDSEETQEGRIVVGISGSGDTRTLQATLASPVLNVDDFAAVIVARSASDDSTTIPGIVIGASAGGGADSGPTPEFRIQNSIQLISDGTFHTINLGSTSDLVLGMGTNSDDGFFSPGDGEVAMAIGASEMWSTTSTRVDFDTGTLSFMRIPVKTDTGDPSSPANGDMYVNTSDNTVRVFADSAWRDLATW